MHFATTFDKMIIVALSDKKSCDEMFINFTIHHPVCTYKFLEIMEFFLNEAELSLKSVNSGNLINH